MTLVELIVAFTILMLLTAMAVPLARYKVQRDKERDLVIAKLTRMGAQIVDAPAAAIGPSLLTAYIDLKKRELL